MTNKGGGEEQEPQHGSPLGVAQRRGRGRNKGTGPDHGTDTTSDERTRTASHLGPESSARGTERHQLPHDLGSIDQATTHAASNAADSRSE